MTETTNSTQKVERQLQQNRWVTPALLFVAVTFACRGYTLMNSFNVAGCGEGQCDYDVAWASTVLFNEYLFWFAIGVLTLTGVLALFRRPARWVPWVGIVVSIVATIISNSIFGWSLHAGGY